MAQLLKIKIFKTRVDAGLIVLFFLKIMNDEKLILDAESLLIYDTSDHCKDNMKKHKSWTETSAVLGVRL